MLKYGDQDFVITAIGAVLWAAAISVIWSGAENMIAPRHDGVLPQAVSEEDTAQPPRERAENLSHADDSPTNHYNGRFRVGKRQLVLLAAG